MRIAAACLVGGLVTGIASPRALARSEEDGAGVLSGADVVRNHTGESAGDMPTDDVPMIEEVLASSDYSAGLSTEDIDDADEPAPDAALEDDLAREADRLAEQLAEQTALLEAAHTGTDRIRIANRIRLLEQELRSLRRALQ